jgi:hypothetical protein
MSFSVAVASGGVATAGPNGSISPSGPVSVNHGSD